MTIEEVVILIETCKNAGVSKIKFEKLEVSFHEAKIIQDATAKAVPSPINRDEIEQEIDEDQDLTDLELQNLMINDPVVYENLVRKSGNGAFGERS